MATLEQIIDQARKLPIEEQRRLRVALEPSQEFARFRRIPIDHRVGEPELHTEGDELLLRPVVDVALELSPLAVLSGDEALSRRAQLFDQPNVAEDRARLRRKIVHEPPPRRIEGVVRRHRDGEGAQQLAVMSHLCGEAARQ